MALVTSRIVMCKSTWPEPGSEDFVVFAVRPDESDDEAITRAKSHYGHKAEFYITHDRKN